ncbi:MAG: hypothetical protein KAU58_01510 [Candidatus Omnitrophica bacterium]|nr:hypothetical protein [Candidatus Omnitrophota bacterium]
MKACKKLKKGVYYDLRKCCCNWGTKIKSITFISVFIFSFLITSISVAYGQPHRVSRAITTTIHVMPKAELHINAAKIDEYLVSLNSKNLLNALSSKNNDLSMRRVFRDGQETVIVTKVCE